MRHYHGYGFFMTAFGYSLLSMAFGLLVLAALSPVSWRYRARIPGAYRIALWSYSTYLSHKAVFNLITTYGAALDLPAAETLVLATVSSLACGAILYWAVEAPIMALRDRHFPSLFRQSPAAASPAPGNATMGQSPAPGIRHPGGRVSGS